MEEYAGFEPAQSQLLQVDSKSSARENSARRNTSPAAPLKRVFNYSKVTGRISSARRETPHLKTSPRLKIPEPKACKLSKIAIYKDR